MKIFDQTIKIFNQTMKIFDQTIKIFDQTMKIFDQTMKIFDQTMKIFDQTMKIVRMTICSQVNGLNQSVAAPRLPRLRRRKSSKPRFMLTVSRREDRDELISSWSQWLIQAVEKTSSRSACSRGRWLPRQSCTPEAKDGQARWEHFIIESNTKASDFTSKNYFQAKSESILQKVVRKGGYNWCKFLWQRNDTIQVLVTKEWHNTSVTWQRNL